MNREPVFHQEFTKPIYAEHKALREFVKKLPDHPSSIKLRLLVENDEWQQIYDWDPDPLSYEIVDDFAITYQNSSFLKKFKDGLLQIDKKAAAIEKWRSAEMQCKQTNERFRNRCDGDLFHHSIESILFDACRVIAATLGTPPSEAHIASLGAFGPGVDLSSKGRTAPNKKLSDPGQLTGGCLRFLQKSGAISWPVFEMMKTGHHFPAFTLVRHNRVTFVPKTAKTDRAIAIEPRWNIFFQKGYGSFLRKKLRLRGIDLNSQKRNQDLASNTKFATIDLSSASDTMSIGLVMDLLPIDWFTALDALRCSHSLLGEELIEIEKFSSMGNGFTFELESLIFYALAFATCRFVLGVDDFELSVYGDDIIVPNECYEKLTEVLGVCGFSVNSKKSFNTGYFRESCGKHYFKGFNVTPFYLKEDPRSAEQLTRFCNQVSAFASSATRSGFRDSRWRDSHDRLVRLIPKRLRYYGPANSSTGTPEISFRVNGVLIPSRESVFHSCIFSALDSFCPPRHRYFDAWVLTIPVFVPEKSTSFSLAMLYEKLSNPTGPGNYFVERSRGHWMMRRVMVHRYVEPGDWI